MKKIKFTSLVIICILFFLSNLNCYAIPNKTQKIYENIYIENINVGGLSKEEAIKKLQEENYNYINFIYGDKTYKLDLNKINLTYNINDIVNDAYNIGKNNSFIKNNATKIKLKLGEKVVLKLNPKYDDNKVREYISFIGNEVNKLPQDARIYIDNGNIKINNEEKGIMVDNVKLIQLIEYKINSRDFEDELIPVQLKDADITAKYLSNIDIALGSFKTKFNPNVYGRSTNIKIVSNKINKTILYPGEEFSFNEKIGKISRSTGFREATIILNGKKDKGVGGGICQVSTTLYNAALYSGLEITQVRNHSMPSAYVSKGRDATVVNGQVDFKFKNNHQYPIYIESKVNGNSVICNIYGNKNYKKDIEIVTDTIKIIKSKTLFKEVPYLNKGEKIVDEKGRNGYVVNTYRIYKQQDGKIEKKELILKNYYPPMNKIVLKGTNIQNNDLKIEESNYSLIDLIINK